MRVPVHDRRTAGKRGAEALLAPDTRPRVVHHPDPNAFDVDHSALRQAGPQVTVVHVPDDRFDRTQCREVVEHARGNDVARVQDEIALIEQLDAGARESSGAARQVGVRDDRDERQRYFLRFAFCTVPARNGRLTKTVVRFGFISA
jgi:hypothetical protein